jgi:hypothetical protein
VSAVRTATVKALPLEARRRLWAEVVRELLTPRGREKGTATEDQSVTVQMEENGGRAAPPQ